MRHRASSLVRRSQRLEPEHRESLATRTLEIAQVFEVRAPERIVVELAREQQRVDVRVKQLVAEVGEVRA